MLTDGAMEESTSACGKTIRCMAMESCVGPTVNATRATTTRIRNTARALSTGKSSAINVS